MQVMGTVARELGFDGSLPELCLPHIGVMFGALKLKQLIDRHKDIRLAIAAYNAGTPRFRADGKLVNQAYVDSVISLWDKYAKLNAGVSKSD